MKAAVVHSFEAPPRYTNFAEPAAAEGEKLVNVTAAGLHPNRQGIGEGNSLWQLWRAAFRRWDRRSRQTGRRHAGLLRHLSEPVWHVQ